ncbi:hypothetical protein BJY59DRAFT_693732 [Rhodotorula toruloides]
MAYPAFSDSQAWRTGRARMASGDSASSSVPPSPPPGTVPTASSSVSTLYIRRSSAQSISDRSSDVGFRSRAGSVTALRGTDEAEELAGEEARGFSAAAARRGSAEAGTGLYARRRSSDAARQLERPQTPPGLAATDANGKTPRIGTTPRQRTVSTSTSMSSTTSGSNHTPRTATFPSSTLSSSTSSASPSSKPLHTPPTLLPRGSSTLHTYSSSSSFHAQSAPRTPTASSSSFLQPAYSDSGHSSGADDSSSVSSDDNTWATSWTNQPELSTSNPDSSGLMFARFVSPPLAPNASTPVVQSAPDEPGVRESRPLSEFDWAAAYGGSSRSPSLMQSQATAPPDLWMTEAASVSPASRPLPPLPGAGGENSAAETSAAQGAEGVAKAKHGNDGDEDNPPPVPLEKKPSLLQLEIVAGPNGTAARARAAAIPAVALDTALPASPATSVFSASPTSAVPPAPSTSLLAPAAPPSNRPSSRASSRSLGPQPPRPPRRQPSNLSMASARSDVSAEPPIATSQSVSKPTAAEAGTTEQETSASSVAAEASSTTDSATSLDVAKSRTSSTSPTGDSDVSPPAITPSATASPGPVRRVPSGPAPSIPEKSARRASTLVTRRFSLVNGGHKRGESVDSVRSKEQEGKGKVTPSTSKNGSPLVGSGGTPDEWSKRFSVPYSVSDFADAYARESFYASYPSTGTDHASPAGPPRASPNLREGASPKVAQGSSTSDVTSSDAASPPSASQKPSLRPLDLVAAVTAVPISAHAASPATSASPSRASPSTPRGDAKARAAAFIADLKRAKAAAAASASGSAGEGSAGEEAEPTAAKDSVAVPAQTATGDSPALPALPFEARPASPLLPLVQPDFARTAETPISPERSPPVPPPSYTKRPSDTSVLRQRSTLYSPPSRYEPSFPPLHRRRPLPPAVQIAGELRRARTAGERARIYAEKINELAKEKSRLDDWIASTRDVRTAIGRSPLVAGSPARNRRTARQDASNATFAPRGDGYRAREISPNHFNPKEMVPSSTPYPGVLNLMSPKSASYSSLGTTTSSAGKSFFSGFGRGSLGRRASKREHGTSHGQSSTSSSSFRSTISGPVQLLSSTNTALTSGNGVNLRSVLSGPRMPSQTSRASLDSRMSSPTSSPKPNSANASRNSFSFGGAAMTPALSASTSVPTLLGARAGAPELATLAPDEVDEEKLERLQDILPQAARADLVKALAKASGDDVLAISVFLHDEASRR